MISYTHVRIQVCKWTAKNQSFSFQLKYVIRYIGSGKYLAKVFNIFRRKV